MPTVLDATVVNQAYDTSGNGGRKLVRLSNGWLVAGAKDNPNNSIRFYVSKDNGSTWTYIAYRTNGIGTYGDFAMVAKDNVVYVVSYYGWSSNVEFFKISDFSETVVNLNSSVSNIETSQTAMNGISLTINDAGTELHAAWASKNSTYPNSFNIRYAKGTINADGSVTWGVVEQVTKMNTSNSGAGIQEPTLTIANGIPIIIARNWFGSVNNYHITSYRKSGSSWVEKDVYDAGSSSYTQSSPSACVAPNGRIWVAWHGTDATDNSALNIRVAYSDDGGQTWSSMTKLTSGNTYYQYSPSITVNKNNEVFVLWYGRDESDTLNDIRMRNYNGSWGSITIISTATTNHKDHPSALYDVTIDFSTPLFIYREQNNKVGFYGTWTITTISVPQGHIGQKTSADKSNILSYSITTDGTMSDITEKINGVTIATRTNPTSGQQFTVNLSQAQWDAIKYGNAHTLTIAMGSDTWTYTFDKRLNANDDILSAVKGVQDLQTHLNGIKAQLGAAIRAKGGTVNDTDAWSAFVSAVANMQSKRWASGVGSLNNNTLTVNNLSFTPSKVIINLRGQRFGYAYAATAVLTKDSDFYHTPTSTTEEIMAQYDNGSSGVVTSMLNTGIIPNGFTFTPSSVVSNEVRWYAYE